MQLLKARLIILLVFLFASLSLLAQRDKEKSESIPLDHFYVDRQGPGLFRRLLSKVHFGLSTGYGSTTFKHKFDGFGIYQSSQPGNPLIFNTTSPNSGYSNWFNRVADSTLVINPGDFLVSSDTATIGFRSKSFTLPLTLTAHVVVRNRYRIGGGYSFNFVRLGDFEPLSFSDNINAYSPSISGFTLKKYFVLLGGSVYRYDRFLLTADAHIGGYSLGKKFDKPVIDRGIFFNLGAMVEYEMSEYFRLFVRPSYELKGYTLNIQEAGKSIKHNLNAFYFSVGASYRIPELRKCFERDCRAQINHAHGNKEYRSRVHPFYKKQNPHYGENYPVLLKYKGKNKRKLNPY